MLVRSNRPTHLQLPPSLTQISLSDSIPARPSTGARSLNQSGALAGHSSPLQLILPLAGISQPPLPILPVVGQSPSRLRPWALNPPFDQTVSWCLPLLTAFGSSLSFGSSLWLSQNQKKQVPVGTAGDYLCSTYLSCCPSFTSGRSGSPIWP